ncbi:MAG: YibE/F family protein, partial [Desulfitobacterium hafniense]
MLQNINRKEFVFTIVILIAIAILTLLPTGFQKQEYHFTEGVRAKVISVNNIGVHSSGIYNIGDQSALIEIET